MVHSKDTLDQTRSKLIQVFRYVQAFNNLQNPVQQNIEAQSWVLWFHDLPNHPCIHTGLQQEANGLVAPGTKENAESDDSFILKVRRPKLTEAPEPPKDIVPFLQSGWQNIDTKATIEPSKSASFANDFRRQRLFSEWVSRREAWAKAERPNLRVLDIYNRLYELSATLTREAEHSELVLGNGVLSWCPTPADGVHHPVLLLRLQLHFNPQIPEFTITETEHPTELYTALFQTLPEINATDIGRSRRDFEQGGYHPLGGAETSQFLQRLVNQLSARGQFVESVTEQRNKSIPLITRDPVLFLRKRTLGFSTAIDAILEALPTSSRLPQSVTSLITSDANMYQYTGSLDSSRSSLHSPNGEDEHILLSKPANAEQLEIARRLERHGAVVVQGPPGTGKTHTIANLLGHLLAEGKSVLVTSHTSKALKVLREKVVKPLQPLCVSILDDDSRKQMEGAIDAITEKLSHANVEQLQRDATSLARQRLDVLHEIQRLREQLKDARNGEYQPIIIAGQQYTPSEAARYVAQHREDLGWIPAPIVLGTPLPLAQAELARLYKTNVTVPPADEREIALGLPDARTLLAPLLFTQLIAERTKLLQENLAYRRDLWTQSANSTAPEKFAELHTQLVKAIEPLRDTTRWRLEALTVGHAGGIRRQAWDDLIAKIERTEALANQNYTSQLTYNPIILHSYAQNGLDKLLKINDEIIDHLTRGGNINGITLFMHKEWKTFIDSTQVRGRPPEILEHFKALQMSLQLFAAREDLAERWQRQMTILGGPDRQTLGAEPERICKQFVYPLRQCLDWYSTIWGPLERELTQHGLLWTKFLAEMPVNMINHSDLLRLIDAVQIHLSPVLHAETLRRQYEVNEVKLVQLRTTLQTVAGNAARTEVIQLLCRSAQARDVQGYSQAYQRLVALQEQHAELQERSTLLLKLEKSAPLWAVAIRRREGIHGKAGLPENAETAWIWRQLSDELDRRAQVSLEQLQDRITQLGTTLRIITTELVEKQAWVNQVRRTTGEQRRALQGWKEITRKIGKGTGKRAAQLRIEAQKLMPLCQTAVPVWIMPLNRVVQNFNPRDNHFDVVIIDEASQADIKALTALYMGEQVVVVGDHEQVTPLAVGQNIDDIERIIDEHLQGIPLAKMFDGKLSIYTLAQTAYGTPVCLQEHFRCVAPIIQFSNNLSYQGKIKPLRDDSEVQRIPPTVAYAVKASSVKGHRNEEEAQTIVSLLMAMTEQSAYKDASFGVISMAKDEQALYIDMLLRRYLTATEYARREILCGNAAQFQGDERDVILLSMVDTSEGPLPLHSEDGNDSMYKKRFNVAASRARDQMWVVHSLNPHTDLKDGDIRKRLILHAENPKAFALELAEQEQRVESEFEKQVLHRLMQAGYRVVPQWRVGAYRIDLVVEGGGKRLAVECDGDRWHPIEKLAEDMARQAILERLGWRFERIRGSQFFRTPDKAMEPIFARLRFLGIPPEGKQTETNRGVLDTSLKERVIRRAAEIRQGWSVGNT